MSLRQLAEWQNSSRTVRGEVSRRGHPQISLGHPKVPQCPPVFPGQTMGQPAPLWASGYGTCMKKWAVGTEGVTGRRVWPLGERGRWGGRAQGALGDGVVLDSKRAGGTGGRGQGTGTAFPRVLCPGRGREQWSGQAGRRVGRSQGPWWSPEPLTRGTEELPQRPSLSSIHSRGALSTGLPFPGVPESWAGRPWGGEEGRSPGP